MYFKRNEAFRFSFSKPIPGKLIESTNNCTPINVTILDVSKNGAKVYCEDNTQLHSGNQIKLSFMIDDISFDALGTISWRKPAKTSYEMGIHLITDDTYHTTMIQSLKKLKRMNS
ncbi:PilZ domain-containing protein [Virgibacillus necropolis]|uniref:PilZ domain-containing protein n=1 Tax=Virgibacillus necropolis TaxID=163877 RepID=UPI00137472E9|nr:PilZ domain-containing protein [Virgibacillus necropolis]